MLEDTFTIRLLQLRHQQDTTLSIIVNRSKLRQYRSTHRPLPLTLCVYVCRARSCSHSFLCIDISAIFFSWAAFSLSRARALARHRFQCTAANVCGGTEKSTDFHWGLAGTLTTPNVAEIAAIVIDLWPKSTEFQNEREKLRPERLDEFTRTHSEHGSLSLALSLSLLSTRSVCSRIERCTTFSYIS